MKDDTAQKCTRKQFPFALTQKSTTLRFSFPQFYRNANKSRSVCAEAGLCCDNKMSFANIPNWADGVRRSGKNNLHLAWRQKCQPQINLWFWLADTNIANPSGFGANFASRNCANQMFIIKYRKCHFTLFPNLCDIIFFPIMFLCNLISHKKFLLAKEI